MDGVREVCAGSVGKTRRSRNGQSLTTVLISGEGCGNIEGNPFKVPGGYGCGGSYVAVQIA